MTRPARRRPTPASERRPGSVSWLFSAIQSSDDRQAPPLDDPPDGLRLRGLAARVHGLIAGSGGSAVDLPGCQHRNWTDAAKAANHRTKEIFCSYPALWPLDLGPSLLERGTGGEMGEGRRGRKRDRKRNGGGGGDGSHGYCPYGACKVDQVYFRAVPKLLDFRDFTNFMVPVSQSRDCGK